MGCIYRDYPQLGPNSVSRARETSLRHVVRRSDAATFGAEWFALALQGGLCKEVPPTEEVVVIGDGAAWLWNLAAEYFPGVVEIVDYMHAKFHLYAMAKQAFGETASAAVAAWVKASEAFLYDGAIQEVVARIRGLGVGNVALSVVLEREVGYFTKDAARM